MKNVIVEYAGSVVAVLGSISFFIMLGNLFMGKNGLLASLILAAIGGI